jgi:uncharacterized protein YlxW (UPF0749 family)
MRSTITLLATFLIAGFSVMGQETAKERAANLRAQLIQVQSQEEELQTRLRQLEEDIRPENIEKSLAGVGSTRPEDLREQRRRQLEIERTSIQTRLNILAASRTRLETRLAQADNDAYHESAGVTPSGATRSTGSGPSVNGNGLPIVAQPRSANSKVVRHRTRRIHRKRSKPRSIPRPAP